MMISVWALAVFAVVLAVGAVAGVCRERHAVAKALRQKVAP